MQHADPVATASCLMCGNMCVECVCVRVLCMGQQQAPHEIRIKHAAIKIKHSRVVANC